MQKKHGQPKKTIGGKRDYAMQVRLDSSEKAAFEAAAKLAGLPLSMWVRERLRSAARDELRQSVGGTKPTTDEAERPT